MTNLILPFDTETTGLPSSKLALNDPAQPHLVSVSALQVDSETGRIQQSMSKLVRPRGWEWDDSPESEDRAFQVHRVMVSHAQEYGRSEKEVLDELLHLWYSNDAALLVAHNLDFDKRIIDIALARYYPGEVTLALAWQTGPGFCTMQEMRRIKKERGLQMGANLKDTYRHFLGAELEQHHSANADAVAVWQIFCAMQEEQ